MCRASRSRTMLLVQRWSCLDKVDEKNGCGVAVASMLPDILCQNNTAQRGTHGALGPRNNCSRMSKVDGHRTGMAERSARAYRYAAMLARGSEGLASRQVRAWEQRSR